MSSTFYEKDNTAMAQKVGPRSSFGPLVGKNRTTTLVANSGDDGKYLVGLSFQMATKL